MSPPASTSKPKSPPRGPNAVPSSPLTCRKESKSKFSRGFSSFPNANVEKSCGICKHLENLDWIMNTHVSLYCEGVLAVGILHSWLLRLLRLRGRRLLRLLNWLRLSVREFRVHGVHRSRGSGCRRFLVARCSWSCTCIRPFLIWCGILKSISTRLKGENGSAQHYLSVVLGVFLDWCLLVGRRWCWRSLSGL
jgi:hypothetical protein